MEKTIIERLKDARLEIQQVSENTFNVISEATGAVMKRLVPYEELESYITCMEYVNSKHGNEIESGFRYVKPVHSI